MTPSLDDVRCIEFACRIRDATPFLARDYLTRLYGEGKRSFIRLSIAYLLRIYRLRKIGKYHAILLDQEILPYLPAWVERSISAFGIRMIVDYDDAPTANMTVAIGFAEKPPRS